MSICKHCGKEFPELRAGQKYCNRSCSNARKHMVERETKAAENKSFFPQVTKWKPKKRKLIETDAEQKKIVDKLNKAWSIPPSDVKKIKPGSKEFEEVSKTITNIDEIKDTSKHLLHRVNILW